MFVKNNAKTGILILYTGTAAFPLNRKLRKT